MSDPNAPKTEALLLKPLSIISLIAAIACFVTGRWLVGLILLIVWLVTGFIGQSLHKDKTVSELTKGTLPKNRE